LGFWGFGVERMQEMVDLELLIQLGIRNFVKLMLQLLCTTFINPNMKDLVGQAEF